MYDLHDLLARVEAAEGASRELDCDLAVAIDGFWIEQRPYNDPAYCLMRAGVMSKPGQAGDMLVPRFTASLDAALALCERVLPGWKWDVGCSQGAGFIADIWRDKPVEDVRGTGKTPALAIVAALLKALQAQGSPGHRKDGSALLQPEIPTPRGDHG